VTGPCRYDKRWFRKLAKYSSPCQFGGSKAKVSWKTQSRLLKLHNFSHWSWLCCSKNFLIFAQLRTGKRMKEKVSLQDIATDKEFSANDLQFTPRHITFIFSSAAASFSLRPSTTRSASYFSLLRSSNSALSSTVSAWTSCHTTAAGRLPLPAPPSYSVNGAFAYSQH